MNDSSTGTNFFFTLPSLSSQGNDIYDVVNILQNVIDTSCASYVNLDNADPFYINMSEETIESHVLFEENSFL